MKSAFQFFFLTLLLWFEEVRCDSSARVKFMTIVCYEQCYNFNYPIFETCKWVINIDNEPNLAMFVDKFILTINNDSKHSRAQLIQMAMCNTTRWVVETREKNESVIWERFSIYLLSAAGSL